MVSHNVARARCPLPSAVYEYFVWCRGFGVCVFTHAFCSCISYQLARYLYGPCIQGKLFPPAPNTNYPKMNAKTMTNTQQNHDFESPQIVGVCACVCSSWVNAFEMFALHAISSCWGYEGRRWKRKGVATRDDRGGSQKGEPGREAGKARQRTLKWKTIVFNFCLVNMNVCVCYACISYLPCSADFAWPPHIFDIICTIFDCMQLNLPEAYGRIRLAALEISSSKLFWPASLNISPSSAMARSKQSLTSAAARNAHRHRTSVIWPIHTRCDCHCQWKSDCAIRVFMRNNCQHNT